MGAGAALRKIVHARETSRSDALVVRGKLPDIDGFTPLHLAAFRGRTSLVRLLLADGAGVDTRSVHAGGTIGTTPLHLAVAGGHVEATEVLLAAGAAPDARDEAGYTPLFVAAEAGDPVLVRALLRAGASVDVRIGDTTPLDLARRGRHPAVAGLLLQMGAR